MAFGEGMWTCNSSQGPPRKGLPARAYSLTGPLISVFPHSTQGNSPQTRDQLPPRKFFHLGVGGGGGVLYWGPQHVPSHRTPEMI